MACAWARFATTTATVIFLSSLPAAGQQYEEDAPIPPGAQGEVLQLRGVVLQLNAQVLEIKGMAAALAARVDPVQAALKDLGATVTGKEIKIDLAADVLFDFDKADLRTEAGPALEKVAAVLKAYPKAAVAIDGHTDAKGAEQYNLKLSERRADAVRRWLVILFSQHYLRQLEKLLREFGRELVLDEIRSIILRGAINGRVGSVETWNFFRKPILQRLRSEEMAARGERPGDVLKAHRA